MSGIVNKVKEALHSGSSTHSHAEGTHGHNNKLSNAADPRVDSHGAAPATGAHDGSYTTSDNYTHGANRGVDGPATRTDGPHSTNLLNKGDPRIDSDADRSRNLGMNPSGTATTGSHNTGTTGTSGLHSSTGTHTGTTGLSSHGTTGTAASSGLHSSGTHGTHTGTTGLSSHGTTGTTGSSGLHSTGTHTGTHAPGPAPNTAGPHKSDAMNKLNPTVDSDLDGSRNMGLNSSTHGTHTGTTGLGSSTHGTHGTHTGTTGLGSSTHGTHGTHTGTTGLNSSTHGTHTGTTGLGSSTHGTHTGTTGLGSSTHGTHTGTTGIAGGKPAVGGFGTGSTTGNTTGTHAPGPAPNTAGPHKQDALNKLDPRVDSDLSGGKTYGGDKTYARS